MAAQVTETGQVLDHHLKALRDGQLDELLDDYVDDSVLVMPDATFKGRVAIRSVFERSLSGLFKPGTYVLTMDTRRVEGDVAYIVWHSKCAAADIVFGTDTFIVKGGKIVIQTFAAKIEPL